MYFGGRTGKELTLDDDFPALVALFTDSEWSPQAEEATVSALRRASGRGKKVFAYRLDHETSGVSLGDLFSSGFPLGVLKVVAKRWLGVHETKGLGVCHGDDLAHIFRQKEIRK